MGLRIAGLMVMTLLILVLSLMSQVTVTSDVRMSRPKLFANVYL